MKTRKRLGRLRALLVVAGVMAAFAVVGVSSASAAADFSQCPLENPNVESCFYSETTGGEFTIGNATVPINKKIVLQGGTYVTDPETGASEFVNAKNGDTLSKTPLNVPGGLTGLMLPLPPEVPAPLAEAIHNAIESVNGVTATAELAGPVQFSIGKFASEEGTALVLPLKIKLDNPFLGPTCYIGSSASPVNLQLTTGTTSPPAPNQPISGSSGNVTFSEGGELLEAAGYKLVDNSFSAPAASGCATPISPLVDPIVNGKEGLPAPSGKNTAILTGTAFLGGRSIVE